MTLPVPSPGQPLVDANGTITPPWYQFLIGVSQTAGVAASIDANTTVVLSGPNGVPSYRDDAQAAAAGVKVGKFYHNGSVFQLRIA